MVRHVIIQICSGIILTITLICLVWIVTPKVLLRISLLSDRKLQNAYTRFLCRKAKFHHICMETSQKWYIYMRNQKLETELAYKSAKCNTLCQCRVITDLPHFIHNQRGVLFVAHKAITVRTSKISSCSSHFYSCKIRSQQVFRGREEKSQQRGNTLPYPLVCKETNIKLTM